MSDPTDSPPDHPKSTTEALAELVAQRKAAPPIRTRGGGAVGVQVQAGDAEIAPRCPSPFYDA